jgi:rhamnose transport system substrate-binding protein
MRRIRTRLATTLMATAGFLVAATACSTGSSDHAAGGGTPKKPANCKIGMLPKTTSDLNFQAMYGGAKEAAGQLGYQQLVFNGPTNLDPAGQVPFIEQWTRQKFCGIMISADDPNALVPAIKAANAAGVKVMTFDADVTSGAEFFLADFTAAGVGKTLVDETAKASSPTAKVFVLTSSLTAPNQSSWLAAAKTYAKTAFPKMVFQSVQPGNGDVQTGNSVVKSWLQAHPETTAVMALDGSALQGAAQAITSVGKKGKVGLTGIGVPSQDGGTLKSGVASSFILYNSPNVGYAAVQTLNGMITGTLKPGATNFQAGKLDTLKFIDSRTLLLGPPFVFTTENVDQFHF